MRHSSYLCSLSYFRLPLKSTFKNVLLRRRSAYGGVQTTPFKETGFHSVRIVSFHKKLDLLARITNDHIFRPNYTGENIPVNANHLLIAATSNKNLEMQSKSWISSLAARRTRFERARCPSRFESDKFKKKRLSSCFRMFPPFFCCPTSFSH